MAEVFTLKPRRQGVSSTNTASNHNELYPRMADPFIAQFPEFRQIELTQGYHAIVDAENYEWLSTWEWHARVQRRAGTMRVYAVRNIPLGNYKQRGLYMHRAIMNAPDGVQVDHENGNGLINCRDNLRLCTNSQNQCNRHLFKEGYTSKYKGVSWNEKKKKWQAVIYQNYKMFRLGYFRSEIEAALMYNQAAVKLFGEFARLNVIDPIDEAA